MTDSNLNLKENKGALYYRQQIPNLLLYLFVFTVFSKEIGSVIIGGIDFDLIGYTFFILYILYQLKSFFVDKKILVFLSYLLISGLLAKSLLDLAVSPFFKQWVPFTIIILGCYDFFRRYGNHVKIFSVYITIAYWTAIFGIIQLATKFFFGIKLLTDYSQLFIDSVAYEPSHYSSLILPAVVYSVVRFKHDKFRSAIILLAAFGTFSSTTYMVFMTSMVLIFLNPFYLIILVPILYFLYTNIFLGYDKFSSRIESFSDYFGGEETDLTKITVGTSLSFASNFEVAKYSVSHSPLWGSGMGGHNEMYFKYFENSAFSNMYSFGLNAPSGHSQIIRVWSEWGFIGLFIYLYFLFKMLLLKAPEPFRLISIACISHFLCKFLKLGGYFDYGTPFFIMMALFNFRAFIRSSKIINQNSSAQS